MNTPNSLIQLPDDVELLEAAGVPENHTKTETAKAEEVKVISFAYPSSINAVKYGFSDIGCWSVDIESPTGREIRHVDAFALRPGAINLAETLPQEYGRYSIKPMVYA